MRLVSAMTYLVTALTFLIQIMFESCVMVFTDLSKEEGKNKESNTTPDPGDHMGK